MLEIIETEVEAPYLTNLDNIVAEREKVSDISVCRPQSYEVFIVSKEGFRKLQN